MQPQNDSDVAMQNWHVPSRDYFRLEQQLQHCQAHSKGLRAQLREVQAVLDSCKQDANRREADALQRAGIEARQPYEPQLDKYRSDINSVHGQLLAAQTAARQASVVAAKDIGLLQERVADVTSEAESQRKKNRAQQVTIAQLQASEQAAINEAGASKRRADCCERQLKVAEAERHRMYRVLALHGIWSDKSDTLQMPSDCKCGPVIAQLKREVVDLRTQNSILKAEVTEANMKVKALEQRLRKRNGFREWCCCLFYLCSNYKEEGEGQGCCLPKGCMREWCCCLCCGCTRVQDDGDEEYSAPIGRNQLSAS